MPRSNSISMVGYYPPAQKPTLYFIGVTTAKSSIMRVFPLWAEYLRLGDVCVCGIDFPVHAPSSEYRAAVEFIKNDPLSLGALVTTHKLDLYAACKDLFDVIDSHALRMGETSCLSKRAGAFICHAKDAITSGLTLDHTIVPTDHFARTSAELLCLGAGGSTIAMSWHLAQPERRENRPKRMVFSDLSGIRLKKLTEFHQRTCIDMPCSYRLVDNATGNDALISAMPEGSLIVNATGLGKDLPGSPITAAAKFPHAALVWELNYRGDLQFLELARAQADQCKLQVHDGWNYFIYGWVSVIAEVFHLDIPTAGAVMEDMSALAKHALPYADTELA